MKTEAYFVCEICGLRDTNVNKIMACEAKHQKPEHIESGHYGQEEITPSNLTVDFPDGSQYYYDRGRRIKGPTPVVELDLEEVTS